MHYFYHNFDKNKAYNTAKSKREGISMVYELIAIIMDLLICGLYIYFLKEIRTEKSQAIIKVFEIIACTIILLVSTIVGTKQIIYF